MKALEIVKLMRDKNGKMVEAAAKIASRYGYGVLEEKIREEAEARLEGLLD
jgi:chromosome transmission fidelity protein 4